MGLFSKSSDSPDGRNINDEQAKENVEALISKAVQIRFDNWVESIKYLDQACALLPEYDDPWMWKAEIFDANEKYDEAIACNQRRMSIKPDSWDPHVNIALIYFFRLGNGQEALKEIDLAVNKINEEFWNYSYQSTLTQDIDNNEFWQEAKVFYWKGLILAGMNKPVETLRTFGRAIELHPDITMEPDFKGAFEAATAKLPSVPTEERYP